jgi:hypothetical protein
LFGVKVLVIYWTTSLHSLLYTSFTIFYYILVSVSSCANHNQWDLKNCIKIKWNIVHITANAFRTSLSIWLVHLFLHFWMKNKFSFLYLKVMNRWMVCEYSMCQDMTIIVYLLCWYHKSTSFRRENIHFTSMWI